eukprot:m.95870 g.95870  ORF g.95870 m.95870 type:complete len:302 (-) comp13062_c0_seq14:1253-2158(-)
MMATSTAASLDAISAHKHKHGEDVDGAVQATSYWIHRLQGPPTYAALICLALGNAPSQTLSLSDIYAFVQQHLWVVPSASTNHNWKSSVRHNLSLKPAFVREAHSDSIWRLDLAHPLPTAARVVYDELQKRKASDNEFDASELISEYGAVMHIPNPHGSGGSKAMTHSTLTACAEPAPKRSSTTPKQQPQPILQFKFPKAHPPRLVRQVTTMAQQKFDESLQLQPFAGLLGQQQLPSSGLVGQPAAPQAFESPECFNDHRSSTDLSSLIRALDASHGDDWAQQPLSMELLSALSGASAASS